MGDIALRGNRLTFAKGGRAAFKTGKRVGHKRTGNTQRENRLEELGRVDAEKAWTRHGKRDLRLEKHRIRDELKHGGKPWGNKPKPGTHEYMMQEPTSGGQEKEENIRLYILLVLILSLEKKDLIVHLKEDGEI